MSSVILARVYESKRRPFVATTLFGLIVCVLCPTFVQAVGEAAHKTDVELTKAVTGTWEYLSSRRGFSKRFITYNPDGTSKAILITDDRGSPRRTENEGKWRVNYGHLIREVMNRIPANPGERLPFNVRVQIDSIENQIMKLSDENGGKDEMRKISHLPPLPRLLTSAEVKVIALSRPQPDYPLAARRNRIQGRGIFRLRLAKDGNVDSIQVVKSTGSKILDDAAEKALRNWRFKPPSIAALREVNVPINFALTK